jgi:WD40 repeat protein
MMRVLWLASVRLATARALSAQQPRLRATLGGSTEAIYSIAFGSDSTMLSSASMDKTIKLWDVMRGQERKR